MWTSLTRRVFPIHEDRSVVIFCLNIRNLLVSERYCVSEYNRKLMCQTKVFKVFCCPEKCF